MEYQHEPFSIRIAQLSEWEMKNRRNNFFELVYILDGEGDQSVNYQCHPYQKHSLFLLPSSNCHGYKIRTTTTFLFIRFTYTYFTCDRKTMIDYGQWFSRLNFIIGHYNRVPGELVQDAQDKQQVISLLQIIMQEHERQDAHSRIIIQSSMVAILEIVARNIERNSIDRVPSADGKFAELLHFIQQHLFDEEKMTVKYLSSQFLISETYFSEYFKRNAGETFQDYVIKLKLRIAEAKAIYTTFSFKEIAYDLGFTDSSHLNRLMKKYYKQSLSDIRKAHLGVSEPSMQAV